MLTLMLHVCYGFIATAADIITVAYAATANKAAAAYTSLGSTSKPTAVTDNTTTFTNLTTVITFCYS